MTDIFFFSYSSKDRERVRPVRDALAAQGFDVFWDQEVPTGLDWDRWIRDHLNKSKCASDPPSARQTTSAAAATESGSNTIAIVCGGFLVFMMIGLLVLAAIGEA